MPFPYNLYAPILTSEIPWKIFAIIVGILFWKLGYDGVIKKKTNYKGWGFSPWVWKSINGPIAVTLGYFYFLFGFLSILYGLFFFYYLVFPPHIPQYQVTNVLISPSSISNDGNSFTTIIFDVEDESGHYSGGQTVSLKSDKNVMFYPSQAVTQNLNGQVAFTVFSKTVGVYNIDAQIYSQPAINLGKITVTQSNSK